MPIVSRGAVGIFAATLTQSYNAPDHQKLRWRLHHYGDLLATDTLPDGTPYTLPESGCCWWGLCDAIVRDRLQTQAPHVRACIQPRGRRAEQTTFDVSCPAPTTRCGS